MASKLVRKHNSHEKTEAQAAMEFMMTYGWALVVVIISISALAYFGVLTPSNFMPNQCTLPAGLTCRDITVDSSTGVIRIVLKNDLADTLKDFRMKIYGSTYVVHAAWRNGIDIKNIYNMALQGSAAYYGYCRDYNGGSINNRAIGKMIYEIGPKDTMILEFRKCRESGLGSVGDVEIKYTKASTGLKYVSKGAIVSRNLKSSTSSEALPSVNERCTGGLDEDDDQVFDCDDEDCFDDSACQTSFEPEICTGEKDEDKDLRTDCDDTDCANEPACILPPSESPSDSPSEEASESPSETASEIPSESPI